MYTYNLENGYDSDCEILSCFDMVKGVLNKLYLEIPGSGFLSRDTCVETELQKLSDAYKGENLENNVKGINYHNLITKFAYAHTYLACHADLVFQIIKSSPDLEEAFRREVLNISCIGSGPGSEVLGIIKYLKYVGKFPHLNFDLYDREYSWKTIWSKLLTKQLVFETTTIRPESLDVINCALKNHTNMFNAEIYTMIYIMSELYANKSKASLFFYDLLEKMKPGSLILFIDNGHSNYYGWFDELLFYYDFEFLFYGDTHKYTMMDQELIYCLEPYNSRFRRIPKTTATISYRVCRKP
jgi:hypothetical protein